MIENYVMVYLVYLKYSVKGHSVKAHGLLICFEILLA